MTIEDETGTANLVIHPPIWERDRHAARQAAVLIEGHAERQGQLVHIVVRKVHNLADQLTAACSSDSLARLPHRSRNFH
jgi:error-prone DNA polymerase